MKKLVDLLRKVVVSVVNFRVVYVLNRLFKKPSKSQEARSIWHLRKDHANKSQIRVHSGLIKTDDNPKGLFVRDELITVYNRNNNKFVCGFVRGGGTDYKLYAETVALDYSQLVELGLDYKAKNGDLEMWVARSFEREFFQTHQIHDLAARSAHKAAKRMHAQNIILGIIFATGLLSIAV